jgi:acyl-CoA reductase-like NAD-dependent aldehyde dehydrogenase
MREESFGPIIGISKVDDPEKMVTIFHDNAYGLTCAVYSKDRDVADNILSRANFGTVYWNCCDRVSPNLPWSGRSHSGMGLTLGVEGITTFTVPKSWHIRTPSQ